MDDFANLPSSNQLNIGNSLTLEAWVKPISLFNRQGIISTRGNNDQGGFQLVVGTSDLGSNYVAVGGVSTWIAYTEQNVIPSGAWTHISYTRDGINGDQNIYLDGVLQNITTNPYTFINNSAPTKIGFGSGDDQYFNGEIYGVKIWSRAMSQEEIQASMYSDYIGSEDDIIGYWPFNEGSGDIINDISGNNNHGLIYGASWSESGVIGDNYIIYNEDFESFSVGDYIALVSNNWVTWDDDAGGSQDSQISSEQSFSEEKSLKIDPNDDIVHIMDDRTNGKYKVKFNLFVPEHGWDASNHGAYYNFQHYQDLGQEWAFEVHFLSSPVHFLVVARKDI